MSWRAPGTRLLAPLLALAWIASAAHAAAPTSITVGEFVTARDGVPLCVYETGNPQGRELLLIHGFSQSHAVFKRQFESSLAKDFRLVAFDLRGHGCSGKPAQESAYRGTRIWADDVATVMRARSMRRPILVGWSFGGYVTMNYLRHHGSRDIAGIVLVGSNAGLTPWPTDPAVLAKLAAQGEAKRTLRPDIRAQIAAGHEFVAVMTAQPADAEMQEIMFATNLMLPTYVRRALHALSLNNNDLIPRVQLPLQIIVGDRDATQSATDLRALAARLPAARVDVVEGAGHATFIDAPERFDALLRDFAASNP